MNVLKIIFIWFILLSIYLLSWTGNDWLSETMPRHQLIQLPGMFLIGLFAGLLVPHIKLKRTANGIAILIFVMASVLFWMLPRSVDMAVINPGINRIMHLNMLVAGFFTLIALRGIRFEIKIVFLGMMAAMLLVAGFSLRTFDLLLCSSFNIQQQKETGLYLVILGAALFVTNVIIFFLGLRKPISENT